MPDELSILRDIKSIAYFIDNNKHAASLKLKLADFYYRAKTLQNTITVDANKKRIIDQLLNRELSMTEGQYLAGSSISAVRKGDEVIRQVKKKGVNLANFGFISLGGGDGTELFTELEKSDANFGLLMEYDFYSVNKFSDNQIPFQLKNSGRKIQTEVIECDLLDVKKFEIARQVIEKKELSGIVVTIHAVLHELSTRSNFVFDPEAFFRRIYDLHDNIILIIREPGIPENWGSKIYITVKKTFRRQFVAILDRMNEIHFENKKENFEVFGGGEEIHCDSNLAIEALTKLFYLEDFRYEKDEKITSISKDKITKPLQASGFTHIESESFYSESLEENLEHFGIEVHGDGNAVISKPQCFTYTVAVKGKLPKI